MIFKDFKKLFKSRSISSGFAWKDNFAFLKSDECMLLLWLQKSRWDNSCYINAYVYADGFDCDKWAISGNALKMRHAVEGRFQPAPTSNIDFDTWLDSELDQYLEGLFVREIPEFWRKVNSLSGIVCYDVNPDNGFHVSVLGVKVISEILHNREMHES